MPEKRLLHLLHTAPVINISNAHKFVIISDLHMGNNTRRDDFRKNAELFAAVLRQHYQPQNFSLILNGDIEELHKFSLKKISHRWPDIYDIFKAFDHDNRLYKIVGNHDATLPLHHDYFLYKRLFPALVLRYKSDKIFVFHGHQASNMIEKHNDTFGYILRFVAKPIGLKNASTAYNSKRKFHVERKVYRFSSQQQVVSIIGHTHRPLFDSLSKADLLKYKIEQLVRDYPNLHEQPRIEAEMEEIKKELRRIAAQKQLERNSLYNSMVVLPCLFNSGCVIGKRGFTAIEIFGGDIQLVYWYDEHKTQKKIAIYDEGPFHLNGSGYAKLILKRDHLDYIFNKIKLLADCCE